MSYYERNIASLKKRNPALFALMETQDLSALKERPSHLSMESVKIKSGSDRALKINGITVNSIYEPYAEAQKWALQVIEEAKSDGFPDFITVFGLGAGYRTKALIKMLAAETDGKDTGINVIEPSFQSLEFILHNFDITEILDVINLHVISERDDANISAISESLGFSDKNVYFCDIPAYKTVFNDVYDFISKIYGISQFFSPSSFKVMVVQPMYGGSSTIGNYIYSALLSAGYDAKILDFSKFYDGYNHLADFTRNDDHVSSLRQMMVNVMSEALLSSVLSDPPDLVVFMAQSPASERALLKLKSMGIKTAYWFVEDYHTFTYWGQTARNVDYFFTIQKEGFFDELKKIGVKNYHYLPLACLPDFHKRITEPNSDDAKKYGSDVSFAGAGYFNRKNVFSQLVDFNFKIWGSDWFVGLPLSLYIQDGGKRFTEEEAVKIYNYSKININLHSSMWHWDINPSGDFLNPRVYEILACGGFQLVDRRKYLTGAFEDGKDLVVFEDMADLRKKIKYYLSNEEERASIAASGYEKVRKEHTYSKRVSEMMNIILMDAYDSIKDKLVSRRENINRLLKETENDPELHSILLNFSNRDSISIKDMVDYIRNGSGRLSKTEAMILMLWAIKNKLVKLDGL